VATLVAGAPVRGSWWAHPLAHEIYHVTDALGEHPDVIVSKLVSGKATYVYRDLWPAVLAVGRGRERWQTDGLAPLARKLLAAVEGAGALRTDHVPSSGRGKNSIGEAARELERRLLVYSEEVHTESGRHAKQLETWQVWARRAGIRARLSAATGRRQLEEIVVALNDRFSANGSLPWQ